MTSYKVQVDHNKNKENMSNIRRLGRDTYAWGRSRNKMAASMYFCEITCNGRRKM